MKKLLIITFAFSLFSCGSGRIIATHDITAKTDWLETTTDNPIINVIQRDYSNNDVEIIIKKKYSTDYVKIMQRNGKKIINKKTILN